MTSNINRRIREHNSGINKSTKNKGPWFLVYKEEFLTKKEAWQREKQIKSYKSGQAFKNLFKNGRVAYSPKANPPRAEWSNLKNIGRVA